MSMSIVGCVHGAGKNGMLQFSLRQPFRTSCDMCKVRRFEGARSRCSFVQEGAGRLDFWQRICIAYPDELARRAFMDRKDTTQGPGVYTAHERKVSSPLEMCGWGGQFRNVSSALVRCMAVEAGQGPRIQKERVLVSCIIKPSCQFSPDFPNVFVRE